MRRHVNYNIILVIIFHDILRLTVVVALTVVLNLVIINFRMSEFLAKLAEGKLAVGMYITFIVS